MGRMTEHASIAPYIREIGRGKDGARALSREQACELFGLVLDGRVSDLEVGAFCIGMRVKGETPQEMAGFLDATHQRIARVAARGAPVVVLPSYNGARKLPVLTPLLGLLLARRGLGVLIHGTATDGVRVHVPQVLAQLGIDTQASTAPAHIGPGELVYLPTGTLHAGLKRLLDVRFTVGLRNSAHSVVKLMNPVDGPALVVGSYTHPEYAVSMAQTFELMQSSALLLRGTEGEPVADARRAPRIEAFIHGRRELLQEAAAGSVASAPELPAADAAATAQWIREVLDGTRPAPGPIAMQVEHILRESYRL